MTDRELLELAAKASGIKLIWSRNHESPIQIDAWQHWNPLTDDGDALRLAVKLGLTTCCKGDVAVACKGSFNALLAMENAKDNPYAATRRAIVRAAAEIGRAM